jgi:hypothetical protein
LQLRATATHTVISVGSLLSHGASCRQQYQVCSSNNVRGGGGFIISERMLGGADEVLAAAAVVAFHQPSCHERAGSAAATGYE